MKTYILKQINGSLVIGERVGEKPKLYGFGYSIVLNDWLNSFTKIADVRKEDEEAFYNYTYISPTQGTEINRVFVEITECFDRSQSRYARLKKPNGKKVLEALKKFLDNFTDEEKQQLKYDMPALASEVIVSGSVCECCRHEIFLSKTKCKWCGKSWLYEKQTDR